MSADQPDLRALLGVNALPANLRHSINSGLFEQAMAQLQQGYLPEACALCEQALAQDENEPDLLHLLALIAMQEKNYPLAIERFSQVIKLQPGNAAVYFNLGQVLLLSDQFALAEKAFSRVLQASPDMAAALSGMGQALGYLGRFEEALQFLQQALASQDKLSAPELARAWLHQGMAQGALGQRTQALQSFEHALALDEGLAQAHYGMGNALMSLGKLDEAKASLKRALALDAKFPPALFLLGRLLLQQQHYVEAGQYFDEAIALAPKFVDAYYGRGLIWEALGEYGKAGRSFSEGLNVAPDHVPCLQGLGNALVVAKQYEYAINAFRRADTLQPGFDYVAGMLVYLARQICQWGHDKSDVAGLCQRVLAGEYAVEPFAALSLFDEPALHAKAAQMHMRKYHPQAFEKRRRISYKAKDKIRIAYVSSDIYNHATAYLIAGLIEQHDRSRFEVFVLSYGPDRDDAMRRRIKQAADKFVDINPMSDAVAAEFCRHQKVDIAVDLKGLTRNGRPGMFAQRAAPVQVNYLGYPGTMAAPCYDYMIADAVLIAPEQRQHYSEAVVYMPHSYQVNDQERVIDDTPQGRAAHGLPENAFVFSCFNNHYKITPEVFACWMRVMAKVPDSVLWLMQGHEAAQRNLREAAEKQGVAAERLIFAPILDLPQHLARHRLAQLSLDTLPYNAHTTASDALWAGLPHLTCMGRGFAGRVAASLLHAVGMPELIAHSLDEYEALAVELALNPKRLQKIQKRLVKQISNAPLFDTGLFARNIENAYDLMYQRWLAGEKPDDIQIDTFTLKK